MVGHNMLVVSMVPSLLAYTNSIDPFNGIAPPSVEMFTLFVDLNSYYILCGAIRKSICV
jgi:hypothetical protein